MIRFVEFILYIIMQMKRYLIYLFISVQILSFSISFSQSLSVNSCPSIDKRNNGNGQFASAAGYFPNDPNTPKQNNPVASNVTGTPYQTVTFLPSEKTGFVNFYWDSGTPVTSLPVITRVWLTATGATSATLSAIKFGPPPPAVIVGNRYFFNIAFYGQNMPPAGKVTFEFANPSTGDAVFRCTYDLQSGASATEPTLSCASTIVTQPTSTSVCGNDSPATFSVSSTGATSIQWQSSTNNFSSSTNLTNSSPYTITTSSGTSTLSISNPTSLDGTKYRAVITGASGCGSTTTSEVILIAKPKPTAIFSSSTLCGTSAQSVSIALTGTSPWSFTYTKTPTSGSPTTTTVSNITTSPYYLAVSGDATYTISSVSDAYCTNTYSSSIPTLTLVPTPTVSITNATSCYGATSFSLSYSTTGSPTTYSISAGTRSLTGFTAIPSGTTLSSSPLTITIPSNAAVGTYDFNMVVTKSGCNSVSTPFTLTVNRVPGVTASASSSTVCSGTSVTLTASGATTYSWVSSPAGFTSTSSTPSVTPTQTTTYTVTGTSAGCTATASTTVTVNTAPTVSISASTTSICTAGEKVTLTASGASTYSWSGPSSYSATGSFIVVTPSSTGTYSVTGTDVNGCTNTASQAITVGAGPSLTTSGNVTICKGSSTTLTVSGATSYVWSPATGLSATTGSSVTATPTTTTTYTVYGTTSGCTSTSTITVTVTQDGVTSVSTANQYIYFCGADLAAGNDYIEFNIQTSSSQTFTWETSSTSGGTYSAASGAAFTVTSNPTTNSTLRYKNPWGSPAPNQFVRVSYTTSGCTFRYYFSLSNLTTISPVISSDQSICSGSSPSSISLLGTTNPGNSNVTFSYQWESSTTSSSTGYSNISGATSSSYSPGTLSQSIWYRLKITTSSSNCTGTYTSNAVAITVGTAISNNSLSVSDACAAGAAITGSTPSGGTGSYTYSWESSTTSSSSGFSTVIGATSKDYTPPVPSQTTWYRRLVTSGDCANNTSSAVAIYTPITSNEISNGQTICDGGSLSNLSVSGSLAGGDGASTTYLWYSSTDNVTFTSTGITTSSYAPSTSVGTRYYYLTVTRGVCSSNSTTAKIVVNSKPTVTASASASSLCSSESVTITASGASSYSWSPSTGLSATTGATVTANPSSTTTYTVTGTNANGCTNTATSAITYNGTTPSAPSPTSSSVTICSGSTYSLNSSGSYSGTIEWYTVPEVRIASLVSDPTAVSTAGTYYVFAKSGSCYSSSYGTVTLAVTDVSAPSVSSTSLSYCSPATADLTALQPVAPSGVSYEWHTVSSSPSAGNIVSSPSSVGSGDYYLYSYSSAGNCFGTASSKVTVTIYSLPVPTLSTATATSVCSPSTVDLTSYNSTTSPSSYAFSWYSANNPIPANLVATPTAVSSSGTYYLYAINNTTKCQGGASGGLSVTINPKPVITLSSPESFCGSQARSITATVTDVSSPTYAWSNSSDGGQNWSATMSDGGVYSGTSTSVLSISSTTGLSGYYYRCTATKNGCSTTSDAAILVGEEAPSITSGGNPSTTTLLSAGNANISVSYTGIANIQWQVSTNSGSSYTDISNNSTYSGVTSTTLVITNATSSMIGYMYRAKIYNTCSTIYSDASTLPVIWNSVSAKKLQSAVLIKWVTGLEINTKDFDVEHSVNTITWTKIGRLPAMGNSSFPQEYQFVHENPFKNSIYNYYRILQRDLDGKFSYSKIVSIVFDEPGPDFLVYPNPADNLVTIYLSEASEVSLINSAGSVVWKSKLPAGRNQLPIEKFSTGIYFIKTNTGTQRLVIQ